MKVICPACKLYTNDDRYLSTTGTEDGVFCEFLCQHCGERLVVQTRDKYLRRVHFQTARQA